jgi:hypothetical protein
MVGLRSECLERIAKAYREDRKERGVAKVVVIARDECREILLEPRVLTDRLTPNSRWLRRIACTATEINLQSRLARIVEPKFYRNAKVSRQVLRESLMAWNHHGQNNCAQWKYS